MEPRKRYAVLQFDFLTECNPDGALGRIALHDREKNAIIVVEGEITSYLEIPGRKRKPATPKIMEPDLRQEKIESWDEGFEPDLNVVTQPL